MLIRADTYGDRVETQDIKEIETKRFRFDACNRH